MLCLNQTVESARAAVSSADVEAETDAPEAEESTGPKIVNMESEHGQMPTEEEVLRMLKAMGDSKEGKEEGHDEL